MPSALLRTTLYAQRAILLSDLHGYFQIIRRAVQHADLHNVILLVAGDVGLGLSPPECEAEDLEPLDRLLGERNCTLLAIRGNHDDPDYWRTSPFAFDHIHLVPDYTVVALQLPAAPLCRILMVGGAISVDRRYRLERGDGYWSDEAFRYDPAAVAEIDREIDVVISHTAPDFVFPMGSSDMLNGWAAQDPPLRDDLLAERQAVATLYADLRGRNHPLRAWHYGHFHPEQPVVTMVNNTTFTAHPMGIAVQFPWPLHAAQ